MPHKDKTSATRSRRLGGLSRLAQAKGGTRGRVGRSGGTARAPQGKESSGRIGRAGQGTRAPRGSRTANASNPRRGTRGRVASRRPTRRR